MSGHYQGALYLGDVSERVRILISAAGRDSAGHTGRVEVKVCLCDTSSLV